jgi:hypothetical protein
MCKAIAPVASIIARTRIGWPSWTKLVASSRCGNVIGACCMARTNAGALLVCDCYTDNDAVNPARATLMLSLERIVVSALGAYVGAIEATYFGQSLVAFGVAIFLLGLMSLASRLDKPGYQYASVHVGDRRTHPTCGAGVVNSCTPVHRSLARNSRGTCACRGLARAGADHYFLTPPVENPVDSHRKACQQTGHCHPLIALGSPRARPAWHQMLFHDVYFSPTCWAAL